MSGFDPRKYHGRPLDEVLGNLNGEVRRALEEAHAVCRLCLRQKNLPARREGHVRMRLWQVEKQFGLHSWYFSQAGQDRYLNERIFRHKRDGTFVEIGGYDGWTGSNCVFFEKVLGWTGVVVEASPQLVRRIGETRSASPCLPSWRAILPIWAVFRGVPACNLLILNDRDLAERDVVP